MLKKINLDKRYKLILSKFITDNQQKIDEFLSGQLVDYSKKDFNFYEFDENFYVVIKKIRRLKALKVSLIFI